VRTLRLARHAEEDIVSILASSRERFGDAARNRYEALLTVVLDGLRVNPDMAGSKARPEFGKNVRTYHLRLSREDAPTPEGKVQRPRHIVVYRTVGNEKTEIIRVLHDSMELRRHMAQG